MGASLGEAAGVDLDSGEVDMNALALHVVAGELQRAVPGGDGLVVEFCLSRIARVFGERWGRFDAVETDGIIAGEQEVIGFKGDRLAVEIERTIEHGGFVAAIVLHGILPEEEDSGSHVLVVGGLAGIQRDGFLVISKALAIGPPCP